MVWSCLGATIFLLLAGCQTHRAPVRPADTPARPGTKSGTMSGARSAPAVQKPLTLEAQAEAEARYMTGLSQEMNDEPLQALDSFYKAAMADPGNEALVLDLSTRFILAKRLDQAQALLKKGLEQPGASALLDSRLAFVQLQLGHTNEAIHSSQNAVRKAPRFIGGYDNLFHILLATGQTNEAARVVAQAAAVTRPDADFLVGLSELYFVQNRAARGTNATLKVRAREALDRASELGCTNFFALQKMADGFAQLGERKKAAATLRKIQELYPEMPAIRERLVDLYLREQDKQGATDQLEALIREDPTNPQAYYLLGILAFDDRHYKEAADYFHKTLLLKPDFEPAYYEMAVSQINLNLPREALDTLGKAREKFNDTFLSEYFSALAYMRQKDYTNAVQRLTSAEVIASATDTNRLTHIFYFQLGSALERAGRWSESETALKKCLKLSPDFTEALNYLGYMYAEKGTNLVRAREMIEKALKAEPDNSAYIDSLGWVLFKLGQPQEALKLIQRAMDLSKEPDATLYEHLGDIQAALGQPEEARQSWRKALELEPSPELRKKLGLAGP